MKRTSQVVDTSQAFNPAQESVLEVAEATKSSLVARGKEVRMQLDGTSFAEPLEGAAIKTEAENSSGEKENQNEGIPVPLPPSEVRVLSSAPSDPPQEKGGEN